MPNFRSLSFLVWPGGVTHTNTQINKYTHIQVKLRISSTGCSPHVDFDICTNELQIFYLYLWGGTAFSLFLSASLWSGERG